MNNETNNKSMDQNKEQLRDIPKWTRRYVQNRNMTMITGIVAGLLIALANTFVFAILFVIKSTVFNKTNISLLALLIITSAVLLIVFFILALKFLGKKRLRLDLLIEKWVYKREGTVSMPDIESSRKKKWIGIAGTIVWTILFLGTMYFGIKDLIPAKYILPISAIYSVPYYILSWYFWQRPKAGPLTLISPILYTIHAVLILIGVPIFFTGEFGAILNLGLFMTLYNFLGYMISLFYSRYALKKLKAISHIEGEAADGD